MMITFLRSMVFFLLLLDTLWNEFSKVLMLKCMCHKINLFLHACGFFMIWFIAVSALCFLFILLEIWRVFGTWTIIKWFRISILLVLFLLPILFGWSSSIMHGDWIWFGILDEAHMYEFFLLLCERLNELSHRRHFPICSTNTFAIMEIWDIYNLF